MKLRKKFPILKKITYLDNASSNLKPREVSKAIYDFYNNYPINPHSPDSPLAIILAKKIDDVRAKIAKLVKAKKNEVIFTSGTTESLNSIITMLSENLKKGDEVIISKYNHNSNILPWFKLEKKLGIKVVISEDIKKSITRKTKIISISQKNNGLGSNINIKGIYKIAKSKNIILINDAAQAISAYDVSLLYSDVITFSSNKIYGPTGSGALIIKEKLLKKLNPYKLGGGAISKINEKHNYKLKETVSAFEAGTPNTAGIIGFGAAIDFFNKYKENISHMKNLALYAYKKLSLIPGLNLLTDEGDIIIIFDYKKYFAQDISSKLAHRYSVYVRAGSFCSHLGLSNPNGSIRVSLGIYNTEEDIDILCNILDKEDFYSIN